MYFSWMTLKNSQPLNRTGKYPQYFSLDHESHEFTEFKIHFSKFSFGLYYWSICIELIYVSPKTGEFPRIFLEQNNIWKDNKYGGIHLAWKILLDIKNYVLLFLKVTGFLKLWSWKTVCF